jgi:gliding motility-associated-like protein
LLCENNDIDVDYTVSNIDSTEDMPAGIPIAFYADGVLVGQTMTNAIIPIGGSESGAITLNFPPGGVPVVFTLLAVVDDDGTGMGILNENNEDNNEFEIIVDLTEQGVDLGPDLLPCINDVVTIGADFGLDYTYQWLYNGTTLPDANGPFYNPVFSGTYRLFVFLGICRNEGTVEVTFQPLPIAGVPDDVLVCDELPNDGFAEFDLTINEAQIINGQIDASVRYFINQASAEANFFPIGAPTAFTNTMAFFQTVYARLEINSTGCHDVVPLNLIVNDSPAITSPIEDYFLCDNDGDGLEIFDLTTKEEEILNTLVDVTLTYHETQFEADAGFPEIIPATAYPSGNAVVWVRAVNYQDGDTSNPPLCVAVASFNLILGQSPLFTSLAEITTCDDGLADGISEFDLNSNNAVITGGNMGLTVTYYASLSDAESPINALPVFYTNTFNPEAIWVRVEDNATGCRSIFMSELRVVARPDVCAPDPIIFCDQDNDGFGTFDLNEATEAAVCGNPAGNLQVSYHLTMADANNNVLPLDLAATYDNEVPFDQLIYIRVNDIATGCYDITTVNLLVEESPQITDPDPLVVCDTDGDGLAVFNLTAVEPQLLFGLTGGPYVVTYFSDIAMTSAISNPIAFTNTTNPQVIFITVADVNNDCESETTLLLQVALPPVLINPIPLELCDQTDILGPDDEVEVFDLTQSIPEITGGVLGVSISFFETQADMASNINEILNPTTYQNLIGGIAQNPQTIWLRAEDTSSRCVVDDGMATLDLIVNPLPSPLEPEPLEACDIDNDGFADFTLTDKDIEIIDNEPGVAITYHDTFGNAIAGTLALISPYTNTVPNNQIIYARATYVGPAPDPATGCFRVVSLSLLVNSAPTIPLALDPIIACDIDMDGFEVFDLTDRADAIYAGQDPDYDLSYYTSLVNAQAGVPEIANPDTFTNTITPIQPIFVRLEEADTECFNIGMFDIMVVEVPIFFDPSPITTCDDEIADGIAEFDLNINNTTITGGDIGLTVRYYNSLADAEAPINALPELYTNTINLEDVWVRVEDNATGCHSIFMSQLFVIPLPELCEPDGLVFCDQDNDGFGAFDLNEATQSALCGNPLGMLQVSYHLTLADAENNEVPIDLTIAYNNTVPFDQEIFIRVLDPATGCFNITTLHLLVEESPQISDPDPLVVCDTDGDGLAVFNLVNAEDQILIGLTDSFDTSYFVDIAMTNEIVNPIAYSNISNPQTIYITVGDQNNDCESTTTLELQVALPAVLINPTPLELCDETDILGLDDSVEAFDLTQSIPEITGGALGIEITFFETQADMESNINVIEVPTAFQNLNATDDAAINPMTIWIRAEDTNSRCVVDDGSITLGLIVNPRPSPSEPEPLEACDIDNDGFTDFTLTDSDFEIIDNEPGVAITYHETESDAIAGVFALMSPYLNIVADNQIIYARATYVGPAPAPSTGCFRVVALTLLVNPTPTIAVVLDPIIACDSDMDGFEVFDLTQREGDILGSQSLDDLDLSYHTSLLDAQAGVADITNPGAFMNMTSPIQPIFVRLEDPDTACFKIGMFDIMVVAGPDVFDPGPFTQCDDLGAPNDGITAFDLTTRDGLITGIAPGIGVQYFESQADADNNENAINPSTAYINEISNPQAVFVRVTDGNTLCVDTSISFNLRVVPNPEPEQPEAIALCDTDGNGEEVFDLTIRSSQILDGESYGLDYYESELLAIVGDLIDAIPDPTMYTNTSNPQTIYVRVTNALTPEMCFEIVELVIRVDPLPDNTAVIDDFILCEIPFDGVAIFDLTTKIPEILVGQDMVNNEVSFYEGIGDANAGVNPIVIPTVYQNDGNPQEIFVGITNSITGCYQGEDISFFIEVREGATATAPFAPYVLCDLEGDNDGFTSFALSQLDIPELWDEILGIQSLLVHDLTFHETFENAADGTNAIGPSYTNIINPQVIYARVENIGTMCFAIAEVILKVEQLPVVVLEESYRLCIDAGGSPIPQEEGEESPPFIETGLDADFYTFEWRIDDVVVAGETGASITAVVGGNYEVTITELASGCRTDVPTIVTVSQAPTALSFILVNGAFANNHTVEVTAEGLGMYIYSIDSGAFQDSNVFMNVSPGMHTIAVKDANGCGESEFNIGVVDYPDYFTPNNDGVHDEWNIIGIADFDPTANIYIFDRYGKLLKQLSPLTPGWNGTYNGNPLPSSDYWFKVEYTEQEVRKEIKGHFTLKR